MSAVPEVAAKSKSIPLTRIALVAAVIAVIGLVVWLVMRKPAHATDDNSRDVPRFDGKAIRYSAPFAERVGLTFAKAEKARLAPTVSVTGTVVFDPERVAAIGARVPGRVRRVFKFPGDPVKVGEKLCEIESAELGQAQAALVSAKAHASAATVNEKRETQLAEAKVSSSRDAELARAAAEVAKAELSASEQRVRALGGFGSGDMGVFTPVTPIAGKVVESRVSIGQSVDPSATLFRVADLSIVWIELAVFERDLPHIHVGDTVEISPQINTALVLNGTVAHIGEVIEVETRSTDVRIVVQNKEGALRPGQSVIARIRTMNNANASLLLPKDALTTVDGKATVFVASEDNVVEPRPVTIGAHDGQHIEVLSGLTGDEKVAVTGVFALKSEIFR